MNPSKRLVLVSLAAETIVGVATLSWASAWTWHFQRQTGRYALGNGTVYELIALEGPFWLFTALVVLIAARAAYGAIREKRQLVAAFVLGLSTIFWFFGLLFGWAAFAFGPYE